MNVHGMSRYSVRRMMLDRLTAVKVGGTSDVPSLRPSIDRNLDIYGVSGVKKARAAMA